MRRFLGIVVNAVEVQSEGLQQVLDNIEAVGGTAVTTTTMVARPAAGDRGVRFPDLHVDGHRRVLARPLWGQVERRLEFFIAHEPDLNLFSDGPYKPPAARPPADVDRGVPGAVIAEARRRGLQAYLQVQPFLTPGLQDADRPVRIDGAQPQPPLVADTACLSSPAAQTYALALVRDAVTHYPDIDGLFVDWAEFGAYRLEDHFRCFCPHCERVARARNVPWDTVTRDVRALWDRLHALTNAELERAGRTLRHPTALLDLALRYPGWLSLLQFKAWTVVDFYTRVRTLLDELGLQRVKLSARGWPPPWNRSSGMDYGTLAGFCDAVTPKLFTFDYSALPRWFGEVLLAWNPGLDEAAVLDALVEWMNLPDDISPRSLAHYSIPAPGEPHPAKIECYRARVDEVIDQAGGRARCYPIAHAYLPEPQWREMVAMIRESRADGMWVQMHAYLSDRKLDILREEWASA